MPKLNAQYRVRAVDRTLAILETLVEDGQPFSLTKLSKAAAIPKSTCLGILRTLEDRGYVTHAGTGKGSDWKVSLKVFHLGAHLISQIDLPEVGNTHLRLLTEQTGLTSHLGVLQGSDVLYLCKVDGPGFVKFGTYVGKLTPLYLTALGKAIAAHLPPAERDYLLQARDRSTGTERALREEPALLMDLEQTRDRGFAFEDEEEVEGVRCVAAPVYGSAGSVVGAVGVTGLTDEIQRDAIQGIASAVIAAAQSISKSIGFVVTQTVGDPSK
jgi:IclR family transcriptional regulator, KDG regulon repressor